MCMHIGDEGAAAIAKGIRLSPSLIELTYVRLCLGTCLAAWPRARGARILSLRPAP